MFVSLLSSLLLLLTTAEVCFSAMSLFNLNSKKSFSELLLLTTLRSQRGKPDFTSVTKISYLASVGQKEIKYSGKQRMGFAQCNYFGKMNQ